MDLLKIGAELFMNKIGSQGGLDSNNVMSALGKLLPTGDNGDLDIGSLLGMVKGGGLASLAASWLGDGANEGISANQIMSLLGDNKIDEFASSLNINKEQATDGLTDMIPNLIDKNSEGGNLLGNIASSVLGKLF
jgi:uncharacterized protein YidB (DUF937 family)